MSRNRRWRGAPHPEFASRIDVRAADRPGHGEGPADEGEPGRPAVEAREKAQDGSKVIMGALRAPGLTPWLGGARCIFCKNKWQHHLASLKAVAACPCMLKEMQGGAAIFFKKM